MKNVTKKIGMIALLVLGTLLLLVLIAWGGLWIARAMIYSDYIQNKETVCKIPGLSEGFVPQGLTQDGEDRYIFTGYVGDTHEMAIYVSINGESKEIIPVDADGNRWSGHGGGAAVAGNFLYVANEATEVVMFNLSQIMTANDGDKVQDLLSFNCLTNASFCFVDGNNLYIGEFFRAGDYDTKPEHAYTTPAGDEHHAWVCRYALDSEGMMTSNTPAEIISVREQVQGFAVKDDVYMLSSSWGVSTSKLDFYKGLKDSGKTVTVNNTELPLSYLDSSNHTKTLDMPAFSEDLTVDGDRVLVSFESACNKYIIGKFFFADKLISYPIPE